MLLRESYVLNEAPAFPSCKFSMNTFNSMSVMKTGRCNGKRARAAFSLIEMLVVIAVMAVIVAFAFPAFQAVSRNSQNMKCLKRMNQIAAAIFLYQAENNRRLPPVTASSDATPQNTWVSVLWPYFGISTTDLRAGTRLMVPNVTCPGERTKATWNPPSEYWHTHYGVNAAGDRTFNFSGVPEMPKIDSLSETMMVMETLNMRCVRARPASVSGFAFRHGGKNNIIFFDGHAEALLPGQIPTSGGARFWNEY